MLRGYVRVAWHLSGITKEGYEQMPLRETILLHEELGYIIERTSTGDEPPSDRQMRKG